MIHGSSNLENDQEERHIMYILLDDRWLIIKEKEKRKVFLELIGDGRKTL